MLKNTFLLAFLCCVITTHLPAHAQKSALNETNITDFINKTTKLTSGNTEDLSSDKVIKYLEKHLHKNARFKTTMRYEVPGFEAQEKEMSFDKTDFIKQIRQGATAVSDYENEIEIIKIKISKDKKSATVETRSNENANLPVTDDKGINQVPMTGTSLCRQILKLNKKKIIQMYNVNCVTDIAFDANGF